MLGHSRAQKAVEDARIRISRLLIHITIFPPGLPYQEITLYFYVHAHVEGGVQGKRKDLDKTPTVSTPWK